MCVFMRWETDDPVCQPLMTPSAGLGCVCVQANQANEHRDNQQKKGPENKRPDAAEGRRRPGSRLRYTRTSVPASSGTRIMMISEMPGSPNDGSSSSVTPGVPFDWQSIPDPGIGIRIPGKWYQRCSRSSLCVQRASRSA